MKEHLLRPLKKAEVEAADIAFLGMDVQRSWKKDRRCRKICLFVANIFTVSLLYMILMTYTYGVVRTLERRFGFSSYQTGFLNSSNDIVHLLVVVFVSYIGQRGNKPRIMCMTAMFSAVAGMLNAAPHFLFPDQELNKNGIDEVNPSPPTTKNKNSSINAEYCANSFFELDNRSNSLQNHCSKEESSVHPAFYVFLLSQIINGIGSSAIFTLSLAYIDENSPRDQASIFLGVYTSVYSLGPVLGLFLSSLSLKLPENLLTGTSLSSTDPTFIGCWWLGYLIGGIGMAISSFLLWFHPSDYNHSRTTFQEIESRVMKSLNNPDEVVVKENLLQYLQGIPKAVLNLLKNKLYLIHLFIIASEGYAMHAVFVHAVRFLEIHFHLSAAKGSIISGLTLAVTGLFGGLIGGTLISKLKLKTTGGIKLLLVLSLTFALGMMVTINLRCPRDTMDLTMDLDIRANVVNNECNSDCQCFTSKTHYQPICGSNNISYFSPCIAGCSHKINDTFLNCKCIDASLPSSKSTSRPSFLEGGTATPGFCIKSCDLLVPFMITMFVVTLAAAISKVPSTMVGLRIVSDEERSFALGINSFILNLSVFVPAPLIFGKLIDSTCLLWQRSCGTTGACLFFDTDRLRQYLYGAGLTVEMLFFTGYVCLLLLIRKRSIGKMPLTRHVVATESSETNP